MRCLSLVIGCGAVVASLFLAPDFAPGEEGCRTGPCHRNVGTGAFGHEPFARGRCLFCHRGESSGHPGGRGGEFALAFEGGKALCFACHADMEEELSRSLSVHRPVAEGNCLACHLPHASPYERLLALPMASDSATGLPAKGSFEVDDFSLCWDCHDRYMILLKKTTSRTSFRDGSVNLHYAHTRGGKGYTCRACHRSHASRGEALVERPMAWTGDFVNFTRRSDGGGCTPGCHEARSYHRGEAN